MTILFVCTGNTCRSPMAQAILTHLLAQAGKEGVDIASAGISAYPGMPASSEAVRVMDEYGLDIRGHRARLLTPDLMDDADLVLCMSQGHVRAVQALGGGDNVYLLPAYAAGSHTGVADPFGRGLDAYRACAAQLEAYLSQSLRKI